MTMQAAKIEIILQRFYCCPKNLWSI